MPSLRIAGRIFDAQSADSNKNNDIGYKSIVTISALIDKDLIVKVGNGNKTKYKIDSNGSIDVFSADNTQNIDEIFELNNRRQMSQIEALSNPTTNNFKVKKTSKGVIIEKYIGDEEVVVVPPVIDREIVYKIGDTAFYNCHKTKLFSFWVITNTIVFILCLIAYGVLTGVLCLILFWVNKKFENRYHKLKKEWDKENPRKHEDLHTYGEF